MGEAREDRMSEFAGRVALVTGAAGALGGAVVWKLLALEARVAAFDRDADRLRRELAGAQAGARLSFHEADLADAKAVERAVGEARERHGRIDHVFNVAGAFAADGPVEATSEETWARMWDANFRSTLHVCRAVVPEMKRLGAGTIVNVGSRAALAGDAEVAAYSVAKTAVVRLTESLSAEGRRHGVRVNCVLPGTIDTPANRRAMPGADVSGWVEPEALVDAMLFLSGPGARAVHGAAVPVFGLG
jgi:NAD(P)-dependent dehydrogenase (short-subunit alcohol dehydrogenase family)